MLRTGIVPAALTLALTSLAGSGGWLAGSPVPAGTRALTFQERVAAQEAIERVYYSHQIGATLLFDEAVPRETLERKVRAFFRQSAALERLWHSGVTSEMLEAEAQRMAASTRMPDRLRELYMVLGNDPVLVQECLVRPALVDRMARALFRSDEQIHAVTRREALALRARLVSGDLSLFEPDSHRSVATLSPPAKTDSADLSRPPGPGRLFLDAGEFFQARSSAPERLYEVGPLVAEPDDFIIRAVLSEDADELEVATWTVKKTPWDAWWAMVESDLDDSPVPTVASESAVIAYPANDKVVWDPQAAISGASLAAPCAADDVWDNGSLGPPRPASRRRTAAVWTGQFLVVWGGETFDRMLNTGGRYDPATDTWTSTSLANAPTERSSHTAVWTGSRMVVWGGLTINGYNGTGGRYDPVSDDWTSMSTSGAPAGRRSHTAIWTGSRMVVWGGYGSTGYQSTGGRYDPKKDSWQSTAGTGTPSARAYHTAVWTGTRMVVWGGWDGSSYFNTGGRYDPSSDSWSATSLTGVPTPRAVHTAVWTGVAMIVWGGVNPTVQGTGARYDPSADAWTPISIVDAPAARSSHTAVWTGAVMIVWGGSDGSNMNTGGLYDPASDTWTSTTLGGAPSERNGQIAVWTGSKMLVWGGGDQVRFLDTMGRYDPQSDSWISDPPALPLGYVIGSAGIWTGTHAIATVNSRTGTLASFSYDPALDTWAPISTLNAPPLYTGSRVWTGRYLIVWGGLDAGQYRDEGGRYDPAADLWSATSTVNAPSPRSGHTAIWTGTDMIIWGGTDGSNLGTGGRYDPAADAWTPTSTAGAASARSGHSAAWTGTAMIVWGGAGLNTGGRYDPATDAWASMSLSGAPDPQYLLPTAIWDGAHLLVWGGTHDRILYDPLGLPYAKARDYRQTMHRYEPVGDAWSAFSTVGAPLNRERHSAVWTGRYVVAWSGANCYYPSLNSSAPSCNYLSTGARYDPVSDSWSATSNLNVPFGREGHMAAWTGASMLIWGGRILPDQWTQFDIDGGGKYGIEQDADLDGFTGCQGDCDDTRSAVYPGAPQICDGVNDDCSDPSWPAVPSGEQDDDRDGYPICAGDCDDTRASVRPDGPQICDGLNNDCRSPGWPSLAGTNESDNDADGLSTCQGDCNDADGEVWATPGEVPSLDLSGDTDTVVWTAPLTSGGTAIGYDTIRTTSARDFTRAATCVESDDGSDLHAHDLTIPPEGSVFYYLVRAQNACQGVTGQGSLGTQSDGTLRVGRACP